MAEASGIGLEFPGQFDLGPALPQQIGHLCRNSIGTGRSLAEKYKDRNEQLDSPLDGPQVTNMEIFRAYLAAETATCVESGVRLNVVARPLDARPVCPQTLVGG